MEEEPEETGEEQEEVKEKPKEVEEKPKEMEEEKAEEETEEMGEEQEEVEEEPEEEGSALIIFLKKYPNKVQFWFFSCRSCRHGTLPFCSSHGFSNRKCEVSRLPKQANVCHC